MRKLIHSSVIGIACVACLFAGALHSKSSPAYQIYKNHIFPVSDIPNVEAKAWALLNVSTGQIIAGKKIEKKVDPASITKLMSNYVIYDALTKGEIALTDKVDISEQAWKTEGSRMFAEVGSRLLLKDLLKSTVIQSGNDAAVALAAHLSGSEAAFAERMNQVAQKIGLKDSRFQNSTGLPHAEHKMSVLDIAILVATLIRDFPDYYAWYSQKSFTHNGITQYNRNKLLWKDDSVDGVKTGHTNAAGYCLVGSAVRNGQRWVAIVMGSQSAKAREKSVLELLNYGFNHFEEVAFFSNGSVVASAKIWKGASEEVGLKSLEKLEVLVPKGRQKDIVVDFQYAPSYQAPIASEQALGMAIISLDGKMLASMPLVAASPVAKGSMWKVFKDSITLWISE